jgi:hypothetical protein
MPIGVLDILWFFGFPSYIQRQEDNEVEYRYEKEECRCVPIEYNVQCGISAGNCLKFFIADLF